MLAKSEIESDEDCAVRLLPRRNKQRLRGPGVHRGPRAMRVRRRPGTAVAGSVSLDGHPLAHGFLQFQPVDDQAVAAGGSVTDGKYAIDRAQGPTPGEYKVIISSAGGPESPSASPPPPPGASTTP